MTEDLSRPFLRRSQTIAVAERGEQLRRFSGGGQLGALAANGLYILAVFPYFQVVPSINAEVQPVGGAVGLVVWALVRRRSPIGTALVALLSVLALYVGLLIVNVEFGSTTTSLPAAGEAIGILLAPLGLAIGLSLVIELLSPWVVTGCIVSWTILGTLQLYSPGLLRETGVSTVLTAAIPRLAFEGQGQYERGVTMFAPEPSYAAPSILLMLVTVLWLSKRHKIGKYTRYGLLALLAWSVVLNSSATLLIALLVFGIAGLLGLASRRRRVLLPVLTLLAIAMPALTTLDSSTIRPLRIGGEIADIVMARHIDLTSFLDVSELNDSTRLASIVQGYRATGIHSGTGLGLGGWEHWINPINPETLLVGARPKPYAYGAFVAMTMGVPGLAALVCALGCLCLLTIKHESSALGLGTAAVALLGIVLNSPASLPAYWVMFLFAVRHDVITDPRASHEDGAPGGGSKFEAALAGGVHEP